MNICTIVTRSYIGYVLTLRDSLLRFDSTLQTYILVSDGDVALQKQLQSDFDNITVFLVDDLCRAGIGKSLYTKYFYSDNNCFRWSMKSVLMHHLLNNGYCEQVFCTDADLYFFEDPGFLWNDLTTYRCILSPHFRSNDPFVDPRGFDSLLKHGHYNAGFVGANKDAIEILAWWAKVCLYRCELRPEEGHFADQSYLSLIPVYFDNVKILTHKGCNVAEWSITFAHRSLLGTGKVGIDGDPLIFIHFTSGTIQHIRDGSDPLLQPYLEEYMANLDSYDVHLRYASDPKPNLTWRDKLYVFNHKTLKPAFHKTVAKLLGYQQ